MLASEIEAEVNRRLAAASSGQQYHQSATQGSVSAQSAMAGSGPETNELLRRIDVLSQKLSDKDKELVQANTAQKFCKQDLEACRLELSTAREELHNEATRSSLLEQRLHACDAELRQVRSQLAEVSSERDALNRTLGIVQDQLRNTSTDAHDKGKELAELQAYFNSMLEAKEASINSLQKLLESQRQTAAEQQQVNVYALTMAMCEAGLGPNTHISTHAWWTTTELCTSLSLRKLT